jgi:hypothetical protein
MLVLTLTSNAQWNGVKVHLVNMMCTCIDPLKDCLMLDVKNPLPAPPLTHAVSQPHHTPS